MSRARTKPIPAENVTWSTEFKAWLEESGRTPEKLAEELGVALRTVYRWLAGEAVPDATRRQELEERGAPGLQRAKPGPAANKRLEAKLDQILQALGRLEAKLERR